MMNHKVPDKKKICVILLSVLALSYGLAAIMFRFRDGVSLTVWSVEFWDVLFHDNLMNFYDYTQMNPRGAPHGVEAGSWLPMIPWILWNFPLWLTHMDPMTTDVTGGFCNAWSKLFLILCVVLLCVYVYKIVLLLTDGKQENAWYALLVTAGSLEIFCSVAFAGQDEVVYLLFLILAVYERLKDRRKRCLFWQVLSVTFCPIMIIPVVVMEAYYDKRIWCLLLKSLLTIAPTLVFNRIYADVPVWQSVKDVNSLNIFQAMLRTGSLSTAMGDTSIPMVILVLIGFAAYVDRKREAKQGVFFLCLTLFVLQFMMHLHFYRYCLYIPFFAIYAALDQENRAMKNFLLFVLSVSRFLGSFYYPDLWGPIYWISAIRKLGVTKELFADVHNVAIDCMLYIVRPLALACAILFLYVCRNKNKKNYAIELPEGISLMLYLGSAPFFMVFYWIWMLL